MHWPFLRVKIAERSMEPALRPGDWLLVRRTRRIRPGQIVLARHPGQPGLLIVKRAARRVPGGWWLESDNPGAGAVDSRRFGPVPVVEGRVLFRYGRSLFRTDGGASPQPGASKNPGYALPVGVFASPSSSPRLRARNADTLARFMHRSEQ
jgi:nickel-type superoxide dismutase maturation protease